LRDLTYILVFLIVSPARAGVCPATYRAAEAQIRAERAIPAPLASPTITWSTGGSEPRATPVEQQQIENVLKEVDGLLGGFLTPPKELKIDAYRESDSSFYLMNGKHHKLILAVQNLEIIDKPSAIDGEAWGTKHPVRTQDIWVHEYGHVYFADLSQPILDQAIKRFVERSTPPHLKAERDRLAHEVEKIENEQESIHQLMELLFNESRDESPAFKELEQQYEIRQDKLDILQDKVELAEKKLTDAIPNHRKLRHFAKGLDEVFADAVAVVRSGDPEVMLTAMRMAGDHNPLSRASLDARSFSRRSHREWGEKDVHEMLSPTRVELGKYLPDPGAPAARKQDFLRKMTEVMMKEMASWAEGDPATMTVKSVNQSLKERIDAEFSTWR